MIRIIPQFIVAEISKNWRNGEEVTAPGRPGSGLLAQQFEQVIAYNDARGYRLLQFQLHRVMTAPDELNETIIAVFELVPVLTELVTELEAPDGRPSPTR